MTVLSLSEINNACLSVVNKSSNYSEYLYACYLTAFNTGARCGEIANLSLWRESAPGQISWQTIKRGGIRTVPESLIHPLFVYYIKNPPASMQVVSKRNLRRGFDALSVYQSLFTLNKRISSHLFRHNRIKQLHLGGMSPDEIAIYFAVNSAEVPLYYINSIIYTN